jgi:hypothetical protein
MEAAAEFMTLPGRDTQLFPQATDIKTVGNPGRGAIISGGKNVFIFDENGPHLPAQAGRAPGHEMGYFHEIFIPTGTDHQFTPIVNPVKILY